MSQTILQHPILGRNICIQLRAGIGDSIHLLPAIQKLLRDGANNVTVFVRPEAVGILQGLDRVEEYSFLAVNKIIEKEEEFGQPSIILDHKMHIRPAHRAFCYAEYIYQVLGVPFDGNLSEPMLTISEHEKLWGQQSARKYLPSVFIQLDSSRSVKGLSHDLVTRLIERLVDMNYAVYYVANEPLPIRHSNITYLNRYNIRQLLRIISVMDFVVSPDSCMGLLALALGVNTIQLYSATLPRYYGYNKGNCINLISEHFCRFCGDTTCADPLCTKGFDLQILLECITNWDSARTKYHTSVTYQSDLFLYTPDLYPPLNNKVLFVIPFLFLGGAETQLLYLLKYLKRWYSDITVIIYGHPNIETDITIKKLYDRYALVIDLTNQSPSEKMISIDNFISDNKPAVVFFHGTVPIWRCLQNVVPKPHVIQILHTAENNDWGLQSVVANMSVTNAVVSVADHINKKHSYKFPIQTWYTVLNGVPTRRGKPTYRNSDDTFVVGFLSRLVEGKGVQQTIEAMQLLPKDITLLIGGWGEYATFYKSIAKDDPRIRFVGKVLNQADFMASLDCFVLASDSEGNSMVLLEATMAGKPIIATPVGAVPELFRDGISFIQVQKTPESIADAIIKLYNDKSLRSSLAKKARAVVRKVATASRMASGYKKVIEQAFLKPTQPRNIAIIRLQGAGDVLVTLPMVSFLRRKYPLADIWYYTAPSNVDLLSHRIVDHIVPIGSVPDIVNHNKEYPTSFEDYDPFDIVIRCNHVKLWEVNPTHICDWYLSMVGAPLGSREMPLDIDKTKKSLGKKPSLIFQRYSSNKARNWGTDTDWQRIKEHFEDDYDIIFLTGVYNDRKISFLESAELISQADLFVGVDSVGIHLANAVGTLAVGIYTSSDPAIAGYPQNINVESDMRCFRKHCFVNKGLSYVCPESYKCLRGISVEEVIDAIEEAITIGKTGSEDHV